MALNTTEEIIEDLRDGKMVIIMDDEDRENEGDLVMASEKATPEAKFHGLHRGRRRRDDRHLRSRPGHYRAGSGGR